MRFSTEPKYRKYVKRHGFLSFATRFGDKYSKKLMDTATKTGIDAVKTASKRAVQKTAKAIGDLMCSRFSKYAWVVPLKDKRGISLVNAFQKIISNTKKKQIEYGLIKVVSFTIIFLR